MKTRARLGVLLIVALIVPGCGSRLPDDVLSAIDRGAVSGSQASSSREATDTGLTPSDGESAASPTDTATGPGGATGSGSRGGSGARTPGGDQQVAAPGSCKGGATDVGVTANEIKVGNMSTDSGPLPGATVGQYRGTFSYMAMINSQGGVCGRKITVLKGDDGLDPAKARAEFLRLEKQVVAFVGSLAVADSGYVDLAKEKGIPYIGTFVDPAGRELRNNVPKAARLVNTGPFVWWKQQHPNVSKAAVLYADVGGVEANVPTVQKAIPRAGFQLAYTDPVRATDPDYTPVVRKLQDETIQFLYLFAFEVNMHVRLVRNMRQQNYDPPIKGAIIAYNNRLSELLGDDADGWENNIDYLPFLEPAERGRSPSLVPFLDWNERVFPGGQLDLFPVGGWGSAAYFVDALRRIGPNVTRKSLMDALYAIDKYDAGGLRPVGHPTKGDPTRCFVIARHAGGSWKRGHPAGGGYECNLGEIIPY